MLKNQAIEARHTLEILQNRLQVAQTRGDEAAQRRIRLALAEPLAILVEARARAFEFAEAENYLLDLERLAHHLTVDGAMMSGGELERNLSRARAVLDESRGLHHIFERMDFVAAIAPLQQAERCFDQLADAEKAVNQFPESGRLAQGLALRARGLRLLADGRSLLEAASGAEAESRFRQAEALFIDSAALLRPAVDIGTPDAQSDHHPAYSECLAALAAALRSRTLADMDAYRGNPQAAASRQQGQVDALRQARNHLLGLDGRLAGMLIWRIELETRPAEKRQEFFDALRDTSIDRVTVLATLLFGLLTLASLLLQLWGGDYYALANRYPSFLALALALSVLVGGIVTGLTAWGDGFAFFRRMFGLMRSGAR